MWIIVRASAAALAVALVLVGCVPTTSPTSPAPRPSTTPVFATDAEALAAATKAYAAYVRVSDEILADGGNNPERIEQVASGEALDGALAGYSDFRQRGLHSVGDSKVGHVSLQKFSPESVSGKNLVTIYACLDVEGVDVLDQTGTSVVSTQRPPRQTFQVSVDWRESKQQLFVTSRNPWVSGGICEKK